ncbi:MAG TPA: Ig-like domain repeat protein [Bradyrhizobium sp.]|nr:Ig-like domain repeat protein [Bradyrhizobium sp.]
MSGFRARVSRRQIARVKFAAALAAGLSLVSTLLAQAASEVAILSPTVTSPANTSTEYLVITTPAGTPVPGFPSVMGLGLSADPILPSGWAAALAPGSGYKVFLLGDPKCTGSPGPTGPMAAAEIPANATALATAVTGGNVVIIGTDASVHPGAGGVSGVQLWRSAIGFAKDGADAGFGAGTVISLSCYYDYGAPATTPTPVPVLAGFGTFLTQKAMCANTAVITANSATSPALAGLTAATLSNWGCSAHEGFTSWPTTGSTPFMPLAIVTDSTVPHNFEGRGFPYILARGKDLTPVDSGGILKICKVAGTGITVGTSFTFTAGSSTVTVPAGPAPGGTCMVGPSFPVGTNVTVTETIPAGDTVSSITVAPPSQLVGTPNLAGGSVNVTIGSGVTEVTFTDNRTGFIEICKKGDVTGTFNFTVSPGGLGPFAVPAGACSPAIAVAAGPVMIHELPSRGGSMVACSSLPASQQGPCNITTQTSTVTVVPGDVSTMTIAFVTNRRVPFSPADLGAATPTHTHASVATTVAIGCAPNPASTGRPVICTAKVAAVESKKITPTGAVSFSEGNTALGKVQLTTEGTAVLTIPTLAPGLHVIIASYDGDADFQQSVSEQSNIAVALP